MNLKKMLQEKKRALDAWVRYESFEVCLEYVDRHEMTKMLEGSKHRTWKKHQQSEEIDDNMFNGQLASKIKDWKGLTLGKLAELTNIDVSVEDETTEIPCNEQNKLTLMEEVYGFSRFVMETISEVQNFREKKVKAEIKNSETSLE